VKRPLGRSGVADDAERGNVATIVPLPAAPPASNGHVRAVMQGNRSKDTRPERALRSALHALGLRYRVNLRIGSGRGASRPDVTFTRARVAVFVDGCFWHRCPEHGVRPRANSEYWDAKVHRNTERDVRNNEELRRAGWQVIRVWEHEPAEHAALRIDLIVREAIARASHKDRPNTEARAEKHRALEAARGNALETAR
jgi:DNA mismatch endonuclease, patch repair protein